MFLEQLSRISDRIGGVLALSLVAKDGIPVESVSSDPDLDIDVLAAELVAQARSITDNSEPAGTSSERLKARSRSLGEYLLTARASADRRGSENSASTSSTSQPTRRRVSSKASSTSGSISPSATTGCSIS